MVGFAAPADGPMGWEAFYRVLQIALPTDFLHHSPFSYSGLLILCLVERDVVQKTLKKF